MTVLLDTHVLIWLSQDLSYLGKKSRSFLKKAPKVFFSPVSIAELEIKSAVRKVKYDANFAMRLKTAGLTELPFTSAHAVTISRFPSLTRHDPSDRMLLAQAASENLMLMTADQKMLELDFNWIIDAQA